MTIYNGLTFGLITVLCPDDTRPGYWLVQCTCGSPAKAVRGNNLKRTKSCGCLRRKHGHAKTKRSGTYNSYRAMLDRCYNQKNKQWAEYGGRGIRVSERWQTFEGFVADMGERPKNRTLDRKDVNLGYTPANCRWATAHQQRVNRRDALMVCGDFSKTLKQWAEYLKQKTGKRWTMKSLRVVLEFLSIEQLYGAVHPCQRNFRELVVEGARRQEQERYVSRARAAEAEKQATRYLEETISSSTEAASCSISIPPTLLPPPSRRRIHREQTRKDAEQA